MEAVAIRFEAITTRNQKMYFCLKGIVTGPRYMYRWRRVIGPDGNRTAAWDDMKTRI